jgi:hypothetical protein
MDAGNRKPNSLPDQPSLDLLDKIRISYRLDALEKAKGTLTDLREFRPQVGAPDDYAD